MVFKHPDILYGLFALIIPILVHLFQFRKFKTEAFTNVKFLRKAVLETRKSSRLKQWLILFTRLGILSSLIIAFAQPYLPPVSGSLEEETVVYLDNSLSMQATGKSGVLLKQGVQQVLENLPKDGTISFFTNEEEYKSISPGVLRQRLQHIGYSPGQLDWKTVFLKAENLFSDREGIFRNFIVLSDFQYRDTEWDSRGAPGERSYLIPFKPSQVSNLFLDSAYVEQRGADKMVLKTVVKSYEYTSEDVTISVHNGENLISRKTLHAEEGEEQLITFTLPVEAIEQGRIHIDDHQGLNFDNTLYFSVNDPKPIEVVIISDEEPDYFSRIYRAPEFRLTFFPANQVDYRELSGAHLIILNELSTLSEPLKYELKRLHQENVTLAIIPSPEANMETYNSLLDFLELPRMVQKVEQEKLITGIHMDHPLYHEVFEEDVRNFQYPKVASYFQVSGGGRKVLSFDPQYPFLAEQNNVYFFTASLNKANSNFQDSPIIVPTFYNMGYQTLAAPVLYYTIGEAQEVSLQTSLEADHILKLASSSYSFIPRQQRFASSVRLFMEDADLQAGHYQVQKDSVTISTLSFNYSREESHLKYESPLESENVMVEPSVEIAYGKLHSSVEVAALWKWFVIFALVFLCIETLILKFFK